MVNSRHSFRTAVLVALLLFSAKALPETPASSLYFRGAKSHLEVIEAIDARANRRKSEAVLIVFDTVSFSPPPLLNEFRLVQDYRGETEPWLDAIEKRHGGVPGKVWVATTISPSPRQVGAAGWRAALEKELLRPWWEGSSFPGFEPATAWMSRLLSKVPGQNRTLCLITGELPPERLADATRKRSTRMVAPERWRKHLLPVGDYWKEEAVGVCLVRRGTVLDVIAPEVRFCDFWPVQELPELPWVSRPRIPVIAGEPTIPVPQRFYSRTPIAQTLCGSFVFFNTDTPSGFGYWPYARAAAITNGGYIFYPFSASEFLDDCPYDPILMKYLAPESGSRQEILRSKANDPALKALLDAARLVIGKTPWHDGPPRATSWAELESLSPTKLARNHRERDKPYTYVAMSYLTPGAAESRGRELEKIIPLYDQAISILKQAQADIASGKVARPHRRSRANLRLGIYWFQMSTFHLEALSLFLKDLRKNIPERVLKDMTEFAVIFHRAIRMSDCLHGYEGRSISLERDRELESKAQNPLCAPQGNILPLLETDPDYRALRHPMQVLKNLDPRLMSRALDMIDAAADVMRHEGRSPWGWMVYYSEAISYTWHGIPPRLGGSRRVGEDDPDGVATPRPKTTPGGPSSGK